MLEVDGRESLRELHEDVPASSWIFVGSVVTPAVDREHLFAPERGRSA